MEKNSSQYQTFVFKKLFNALFFLLAIIIAVLSKANVVSAQSAVVRTAVGNPPTLPLVELGENIKAAYDACNRGATYESSGINLDQCLKANLEVFGYDPQKINDFFLIRRASSMAYNPVVGAPCTQCLGYIGLILSLATENPTALTGFGFASDLAPLETFSSNGTVFNKLSPTDPLLPGDIGVRPSRDENDAGHILMVAEVRGNFKFLALESNGYNDCRITEDRELNKDLFVFFRQAGR